MTYTDIMNEINKNKLRLMAIESDQLRANARIIDLEIEKTKRPKIEEIEYNNVLFEKRKKAEDEWFKMREQPEK